MSLVLAEEVCEARSCCSISTTRRSRPAASRAMPAPLMPPPTMARSKRSSASVVATNLATQLLGPARTHLAGEPSFFRGPRRARGLARHRRPRGGFEQSFEALQCVAAVAFLRAMAACHDQDFIAVAQAPASQHAQSLFGRRIELREVSNVKAQLRGARHL